MWLRNIEIASVLLTSPPITTIEIPYGDSILGVVRFGETEPEGLPLGARTFISAADVLIGKTRYSIPE